MTVRIRLQRHGAKKRPFYRVVAADQRAPRDGRFIELLGTYDPLQDPPAIRLKKDRVDYWLGVGADPSDTAKWIIGQLEKGAALNLSEEGAAAKANAAQREAAAATKAAKIAALAKAGEEAAAAAKAAEEAKAAEAKAAEAPAEEAAEAPAEETEG